MMKKIGIVTPYGAYNYGSKLQAYAMLHIVESHNFKAEIISNRLAYGSSVFDVVKFYAKRVLGSFYTNPDKNRITKRSSRYGKETPKNVLDNILLRYRAIDSFNVRLNVIKKFGFTNNLSQFSRRYDAIFTGSDQVWKPTDNVFLDFYAINFAPINVKRVAYAPSFGYDYLPKDKIEYFKDFTSKYIGLSCREISGAKILSELTGKTVPTVLDPTILVGRKVWDKICDEKKAIEQENYVLCYLLGTSQEHREIAKIVAKYLGCIILHFAHFREYVKADDTLGGKALYDVNPEEFLGYIKNAKFVVTDSFHCSAFSMQYHTSFITLQRYGANAANSTNTRIYSLLQQFGLENRILNNKEELQQLVKEDPDWNFCEKQLDIKRTESNDYLDKIFKILNE